MQRSKTHIQGETMIYRGNATNDGAPYRGWILGPFVNDSPERSTAVQVKWSKHQAGETRRAVAPGDSATSVAILVTGVFTLIFADGPVTLVEPGEYVMWGDESHTWKADTEAIVITVRWDTTTI